MSRDSSNLPKTRKHLSAPSSLTRQSRKTIQRLSGSSSLSSNRNSSAQSDDDNGLYMSAVVKNASYEDKDGLIRKLKSQTKELRHKLRILEECVENKEYSLGMTAREKERALGEIRRLERNNKQLRQQLNDERNHYLEEKEKFCEEMTRYKKRLQEFKMSENGSKSTVPISRKISASTLQKGDSADVQPMTKDSKTIGSEMEKGSEYRKISSVGTLGLYEGQDLSLQMAALRTENAKLRATANEREEKMYELCLRFLRMKHSKNDLKHRFQDLENEYLQVITNLMEKIDEAREEFNFVIDQKFKKPLHPTNAKYLRMVQRSSKITFENITLRMELQNLKEEINKRNSGQGNSLSKTSEEAKSRKSKPNTESWKNHSREGVPKASDTDSNYMSKTSTTEPSTGSFGDGKSNESLFAEAPDSQNLLSEDILQKLFKRVDSRSNLNGGRSGARESIGEGKGDKVKSAQNVRVKMQPFEGGSAKRYVRCSLNSKKFHKVTNNSDKKKTTKNVKKAIEDKEKPTEGAKRSTELLVKPKSRGPFMEAKDRGRSCPDSDKTDSPRELSKVCAGWSRVKDKKSGDGFGGVRRYRSRKDRLQRKSIKDSCGLEEKLDTDEDISPVYDCMSIPGSNDDNTSILPSHFSVDSFGRKEKVIDQQVLVKHRVPSEIRERIWQCQEPKAGADSNSEDSAIGASIAKNRNRNSVSLHDELMEATKSESQTDDPFWIRELNLHSLILKSASSSKTYRLSERNSRFSSQGYDKPLDGEDDGRERVTVSKTKFLWKGHETKTSRPQSLELRKPGSEHDTSVEVPREATGIDPLVPTDTNNEVVLRFLMSPPSAIVSTQSLLYDEVCKGTSMQSVKELSHPQNREPSQLMLPAANMPSSCTMIESAEPFASRESYLASRTNSAPALIESDWLNNIKMSEMKDCSTNTEGNT